MFSATVSRRGNDPWGTDDVAIVECLLSKHVTMVTYRDAVRRKAMTASAANQEARIIRDGYDANIANLLKHGGDDE